MKKKKKEKDKGKKREFPHSNQLVTWRSSDDTPTLGSIQNYSLPDSTSYRLYFDLFLPGFMLATAHA